MYIPNGVFILLGNIGMAVWGSVVRYVFLFSKKGYQGRVLLAGLVSATFMGMVVFLSYSHFGLEYKFSFVVSGILGYTGPDSVDIIRRIILYKATGLKKQDYENTKEVDGDGKTKDS